jgi:hypothetical protein
VPAPRFRQRLGVVQLEGLRAQLLQVLDGGARLELELFLGGDLVLGRDPQHVAGLAHAQALGLQDDVERLVPGHVLQAQRHRARQTESDVTMLKLVKSAITCSSERTSMFWKFSDSFSPA